jgi:DNA-binding transcriptional regulator YhcF (GntR family)
VSLVVSENYTGTRLAMPMSPAWDKWRRMNPTTELIYVDDAEGRPRGLTPKQYMVLILVMEMTQGVGMTMRQMAQKLEVAPSTVSRAMTKLASWGLIAYMVGRGRWAGLVIVRRVKGDGLDRFRQAAKARVRRWSEAVKRRISRLEINVAPYVLEEHRGYDSLTAYVMTTDTYKGATLTAQRPWTPEELRSMGII